jgi:hypothetical protein
MMQRFWRNVLGVAVAGGLLAVGSPAQAAGGEPNIKIGLDRLSMTGATYTHETLAAASQEKNKDALSGADLFIEWIASDHFGLEVAGTIAPLERSYKLGSGATPVSDNVNESASYTTVGVNLYFTRATRKGFQYSIGVATGTVQVKHEFEGGTLGKASSSSAFAITAVKMGVEWVTELAGVRLQYQSTSGAASNTTELTGVKQTVDYSGGILALGVYAFF